MEREIERFINDFMKCPERGHHPHHGNDPRRSRPRGYAWRSGWVLPEQHGDAEHATVQQTTPQAPQKLLQTQTSLCGRSHDSHRTGGMCCLLCIMIMKERFVCWLVA